MPTEIRRMLFTMDELECLLDDQAEAGVSALPKGKVIDVAVKESEPVVLTVTLQQADGRQVQRTLDKETIVALMAFFYQQNGIPMPRKAQKTVKINGNGALVFDMALRVTLAQAL